MEGQAMRTILLFCLGLSLITHAATLPEYLNFNEGKRLFEKGLYEEAEVSLKKALEHGKNVGKSYRLLGDIYYKKGDFPQALKFYDQSGQFLGETDDLLFNKGNAYLNMQQFDPAIQAYTSLLRNNASDQGAKKNLEIALRLRQDQQQNQNNQQDQSEDSESDEPESSEDDQQNESDNPNDPGENDDSEAEEVEPETLEEEQANQILKLIEENEADVRKKYRPQPELEGTIENDW